MPKLKGYGIAPYASLRESVQIVERVYKDGSGDVPLETLATFLGYSNTKSSGFLRKLSSLRRFGVGETEKNIFKLSPLGFAIAAPTSPEEKLSRIFEAFNQVNLFRVLHERYGGKPLPDTALVKNILVREFGVEPKYSNDWVKQFFDALESLSLIERKGGVAGGVAMVLAQPPGLGKPQGVPESKEPPPMTEGRDEFQREPVPEEGNELRLKLDSGTVVIRIPSKATNAEIDKIIKHLELMKEVE